LLASTLLSGCVLTDETNLTGGDFLAAHGLAAGDSTSRTLALPVLSVESVPMEGVPGANGTEDVVLGSLGNDSIRLVLGFDLSDKTQWDARFLKQKDSLVRLRLSALDSFPGMIVRARFVFLPDASFLPGLFAGLEPSRLGMKETVDEAQDTLGAASASNNVHFPLPESVSKQLATKLADSASISSGKNGWLAILIDTRPGSSDRKARFSSTVQLVGPDTAVVASAPDTSGTVGLGVFESNKAWMSVGFRQAGSPFSFGWWPSGGNRLRARIDGGALRSSMYQAFSIANPDSSGGFDNTFNILQARLSTKLSKVRTESDPGYITISSSVLVDSGDEVKPLPLRGEVPTDSKVGLKLNSEDLRLAGYTKDVELTVNKLEGVVSVVVNIDGSPAVLPTRQSLARGSFTNWTVSKFYLPIGDSVEFRLSSVIRVRVTTSDSMVKAKHWRLESSPVADDQSRNYDSLRHDAYVWSGTSKIVHEARTPFAQALNRNKPVEFDLVPSAFSNFSNRLIIEPADSAKLFESVTVVARPLVGRNY
jgi:hypothetical protein